MTNLTSLRHCEAQDVTTWLKQSTQGCFVNSHNDESPIVASLRSAGYDDMAEAIYTRLLR